MHAFDPFGYETGPIRPPSEAGSLLIRVTRNCAWNRCTFCPVYKGRDFSLRSLEEVAADVRNAARIHGNRFRTAFLQDADSLGMPAPELVRVIRLIKECFPRIRRITTYGRASTIAKMTHADLAALREAGLTRVHVGLESGSMAVLRRVKKGASPRIHIQAGRLVEEAGLSLSEYVMPGLGGRALWREHAVETARVLNRIDPSYIRIRTLFVSRGTLLDRERREGRFAPLCDDETVREIRVFIEHLDGIASRVVSDHSLNLLMELRGKLPEGKVRLIRIIDAYLSMPDRERLLFRLGRRIGALAHLDQLSEPSLRSQLEATLENVEKHHPGEVDTVISDLVGRYI